MFFRSKDQPEFPKVLEDILKRKRLLHCIVEPAARDVSFIQKVEFSDFATCKAVESALLLSYTSHKLQLLAKTGP